VYQKSAELFKPCFLELGGKDAAIVLENANLENAAKSILWGSCVNNGHSCLSIERVYVHSSILDDFVQLLCKEAKAVKMAYDDPRIGHIGPIISDRQVKIIDDHLKDALEKGAKLIEGSDSCTSVNGGYYCRPTILSQVDHTMKIMTEETFGPIIPIMTFESTAEAIRLANDSIFGLSGAVFAQTNDEAMAVAKQFTAGAISINECALTATVHDGEKNSFKMSGLGGSRMGPASLQRFMRRKAYLINQNPNASPWWFRDI
jgi:acyl-CoA reductase-like NAD-dependent aldehyde dehydrogenase